MRAENQRFSASEREAHTSRSPAQPLNIYDPHSVSKYLAEIDSRAQEAYGLAVCLLDGADHEILDNLAEISRLSRRS